MSLKRQAVASSFEGVCRTIRVIAQDEEGGAAIEYALLAALIAVVAVGSITTLGDRVEEMWGVVSVAVSDALEQ